MKNESNSVITLEQARKVLEVVDAGLCAGLGEPIPGKLCVEAAVCYALGQEHGDEPECVNAAVRRFKIRLNDSNWSDNSARAAGMRRLAIAQLGTNDPSFNQKVFVAEVVKGSIKVIVPIALRALLKIKAFEKWHAAIEVAALLCESTPTRASAIGARDLAREVRAAAAYDATYATYAAAAAAAAAADAAAAAAAAAADAADAADATYAAAAAAASYAAAKRNSILGIMAKIGVEALRLAGAKGIELMDQLIPSEDGQ